MIFHMYPNSCVFSWHPFQVNPTCHVKCIVVICKLCRAQSVRVSWSPLACWCFMEQHAGLVSATALSKVPLFSQGQQSQRRQHWYSCCQFSWSRQGVPHHSNVSYYSVLGSRWNVRALASLELYWCCIKHLVKGEHAEQTFKPILSKTWNC